MFSHEQVKQIKDHGLNVEEVESQIKKFEKGVAFAKIDRPATLGDGIINLDEEAELLIKTAEEAIKKGLVQKFVPASGAASRMFKVLNACLNNKENQKKFESQVQIFQEQIENFPFYVELMQRFEDQGGLSLDDLLDKLLSEKGLNCSNLPKGLLSFHTYGNEVRTAFEEHLVEADACLKSADGRAKLHFTVSPEHLDLFEEKFIELEGKYGIAFEITYSVQKPETDTIAVDLENKPFLDKDDKLVFRPGGHGALINNLNDLEAEIITIKNIDNVAPDWLKAVGIKYKKVLIGYLSELQKQIFSYLDIVEGGNYDFEEIKKFAAEQLNISDLNKGNLLERLNRPIAICAMVKNAGEPGGGPYWVDNRLQIVEKDQISQEDQNKHFPQATHFNPVDIVCGVYDYRSNKFNLLDYVDQNAFFIAEKSKDGKSLKALERPGLWNGAMANWIKIFVEVPIETFTPVKTVFDFLRPEHQPK